VFSLVLRCTPQPDRSNTPYIAWEPKFLSKPAAVAAQS